MITIWVVLCILGWSVAWVRGLDSRSPADRDLAIAWFLKNAPEPATAREIRLMTGIPMGLLYSDLARLERKGKVKSGWDQPQVENRIPRRLYFLYGQKFRSRTV